MIPREKWDVDTRSICARVGFELFRIAQEANDDISRATLPLVLTASQKLHEPEQTHSDCVVRNEEDDSFREVLALFKLASSPQDSTSSPDTSTPAPSVAAVASPRGAGAKGAAAAVSKDKTQSNTPQATPRSTGDSDKTEVGGKLQSLDALLQAAGNDLAKVFSSLEQQSSSDRRSVEFASKICGAVVGAGTSEVPQMDKFLSSIKVAGVISSQFRATLTSLGGGSLLPELKDAGPVNETSPPSALDIQTSETPPLESTGSEAGAGADEVYLYRWCGELFFIQSVLLVGSSCAV